MNIYFASGGGDLVFMLIAVAVWAIIQAVNRKAQKPQERQSTPSSSEDSTQPVPMDDLGTFLENLRHLKPETESTTEMPKTQQTVTIAGHDIHHPIEPAMPSHNLSPDIEVPEPPPVPSPVQPSSLSDQFNRRERRRSKTQKTVIPAAASISILDPVAALPNRKQVQISLHHRHLLQQTIVAREILGPPIAMRRPASDPVQK